MYEGLIIIDVLLTGYKNADKKLLDKFFDSPAITAIRADSITLGYGLSHDPQNIHYKQQKAIIDEAAKQYLQKYKKTDINQFTDYWWTGYSNFAE